MDTLKIFQPSYGPHGEPFAVRARFADHAVRARFADHIEVSFFWTASEANEQRDRYFDAAARSVHVRGLPAIVAAGGFPRSADRRGAALRSPKIAD